MGNRRSLLLLTSLALCSSCSFDDSGLSKHPPGADGAAPNRDLFFEQPAVLPDVSGETRSDSTLAPDTLAPDTLAPDTLAPDTLAPCPPPLVRCSGVCVDLQTDPANCGACANSCGAPASCSGGSCVKPTGCADGSDEQTFTQGMVGCAGAVVFSQRASLCSATYRPCSAKEWIDRRDGQAPTYNYWTDTDLDYWGSGSNSCSADPNGGGNCYSSTPMRVCAAKTDPLNNKCTWINCGWINYKPIEYFGGCNGNYTAGTLCCPQ